MFCRYCGKEIHKTKSFCPYCGKQLAQPPTGSEARPEQDNRQNAPKRKKHHWPLLLCLLLLLGFATVCGLLYFDILDFPEIPVISSLLDSVNGTQGEPEPNDEDLSDEEIPENATTAPETTAPPETEPATEEATTAPTVHEHIWSEASYTAPRTCLGCSLTEGLSLGTPLTQKTVLENSESGGNDIVVGNWADVSGQEHQDAVYFWVNNKSGYANMEYAVYQLAGEYDILQGAIAVASKSDTKAAIRFRIYGDDVLLWESKYIASTQTEEVLLEVSGVQQLRVECETDETCHGYGLLDVRLHVG